MGRTLEMALGALNGLVGDYLVRTGNGLATPMTFVRGGVPVAPAEVAGPRRVVVLLHGLMCSESVWEMPDGGDYGTRLERDLGYAPLHVRYNSGLPIADGGMSLTHLLDELFRASPGPIDELLLLGFSMGGLVLRSACHVAATSGSLWLPAVRRAIYLGTPHLGAPAERVGRVLARVLGAIDDPYTRLAAELGELRSDGIKDLGDADLRHEDRARRRVSISLRDPRHPVPLLPQIQHHLIAGTLGDPRLAALFGDGIVPVASGVGGTVASGAGQIALPPEHVKVLPGVAHLTLAHHPDVYAHIRSWCASKPEENP